MSTALLPDQSQATRHCPQGGKGPFSGPSTTVLPAPWLGAAHSSARRGGRVFALLRQSFQLRFLTRQLPGRVLTLHLRVLTLLLGTAIRGANGSVWVGPGPAGSRAICGRSNASPRGRQPGSLSASRRTPRASSPRTTSSISLCENSGHRHGRVSGVTPDAAGISGFETIFCPSVPAEASLSAVRWPGRCPST